MTTGRDEHVPRTPKPQGYTEALRRIPQICEEIQSRVRTPLSPDQFQQLLLQQTGVEVEDWKIRQVKSAWGRDYYRRTGYRPTIYKPRRS